MQTTTFYAYKGGTGRTLTLANAAKYLSRLGQSVLAIDLDLEAPGLHHKLRLGSGPDTPTPAQGVVDYLSHYTERKAHPASLTSYVMDVPREEERDGRIYLMPAGNVLDNLYWRKLAAINWHNFLFGQVEQGLEFFVGLKQRIQAEFKPDFLLVDARTGITEVGGVATTVLADQVVCFMLNNQENLEGTRVVLRGIERASAARPTPIRIIPVIARLPRMGGRRAGAGAESEAKVVEQIRLALCAPKAWDPQPLDLPSIHVLHSEESLAINELLRIGSNRAVDDSPLLRDYLRLFSEIIPSAAVTPHLDRLVSGALKDLLDKPERAQSDLEALATYCPHPTSFLALLKFYRLRAVAPKQLLQTAVRYWEFSRDSEHPLLRQVIQESFKPDRAQGFDEIPQLSDFVEAVWTSSADRDPALGLRVANYLFRQATPYRAARIVRTILEQPPAERGIIAECISMLVQGEQLDYALSVIDQWAPQLSENSDFQAAWAYAVVQKGDAGVAQSTFASKNFRPAIVMGKSTFNYIRLLMLAGKREELEAAMASQLEQALAKDNTDEIVHMARVYEEVGQIDRFRNRVRRTVPKQRAEEIFDIANAMARRARAMGRSRSDVIPF